MTTANGTNGITTYVQNTNAKRMQEAFAVRTKSRFLRDILRRINNELEFLY